MKTLQEKIEDLRVQLDFIIKQVDYQEDLQCFKYLCEAKDQMGLAQLALIK